MLIEGKNAVLQALTQQTTINKLLIDANFKGRRDEVQRLAGEQRVRIEFLPKAILDKKSQTGHHQGYLAEAVDFAYCGMEDILAFAKQRNEDAFVVLLDGIEDPHNFGAIIRSCECAGVHGIIIPKNRACQVNETVMRTSTGAAAGMRIAKVTNLKEAVDYLRGQDVWVYAAEVGGNNMYAQRLSGPIGIVVGSEGQGIKPSLQAYCDGVISLPMRGYINSLNASVACGVVLFEIVRQRLAMEGGHHDK